MPSAQALLLRSTTKPRPAADPQARHLPTVARSASSWASTGYDSATRFSATVISLQGAVHFRGADAAHAAGRLDGHLLCRDAHRTGSGRATVACRESHRGECPAVSRPRVAG